MKWFRRKPDKSSYERGWNEAMDFIAHRTIITKIGNITETKYGKKYEYSADIEATIFFDPSRVHIESRPR